MKIFCHAILGILISFKTLSNTINDPHLPIGHCYHWLNEGDQKRLSFKYDYAQKHEDEFSFYTTEGNGAAAGAGIYCAKSPSSSYDYGDRVVRIDFVADVVVRDGKKGGNWCGHDGKYYKTTEECNSKVPDVLFYSGGGRGNKAWYVIRNPMAVAKWSANSELLRENLLKSRTIHKDNSYLTVHFDQTLKLMQMEAESIGAKTYFNGNARLNIAQIIQDNPMKLLGIPALSVVFQLKNIKEGSVPKNKLMSVYRSLVERIFNDPQISFKDLVEAFDSNPDFVQIFNDQLAILVRDKRIVNNPYIVLRIMERDNKLQSLDPGYLDELWSRFYKEASLVQFFKEDPIAKSSELISAFKESISVFFDTINTSSSKQLIDMFELLSIHFDKQSDIDNIVSTMKEKFDLVTNQKFIENPPNKSQLYQGTSSITLFGESIYHLKLMCRAKILMNKIQAGGVSLVVGKATFNFDVDDKVCEQTADRVAAYYSLKKVGMAPEGNVHYMVRMKTKQSTYYLYGTYLEQLVNQCRVIYDKRIAQAIGKVQLQVNDGVIKSKSTMSYWKDSGPFCDAVKEVLSQDVLSREMYQRRDAAFAKGQPFYMIKGHFSDKYHFVLGITELSEFYPFCYAHLKEGVERQGFSDFTYSIGHGQYQTIQFKYSRNAKHICLGLNAVLNGQIKPQKYFDLRKQAIKEKKRFHHIHGEIENIPFSFGGSNASHFYDQCTDKTYYLFKYIYKSGVRNVKWSANGNPMKKHRLSNSRTITSYKKYCKYLKTLFVSSGVPNDYHNEYRAAGRGRLYLLTGSIRNLPFRFWATNTEDVWYQCKEFYYDTIDHMYGGNSNGIDMTIDLANNINYNKSFKTMSGKSQICYRMMTLASYLGVPYTYVPKYRKKAKSSGRTMYEVKGKMDNEYFRFEGSRPVEIDYQCEYFHDTVIDYVSEGKVRKFEFQIDNGRPIYYNRNGRMNTLIGESAVCDKLIELLKANKK